MYQSIAESVNSALHVINSYVWWIPLLVLLVGTHLFLTIRLRIIQRFILTGIRLSLGRGEKAAGEISHFGALTTALAATIGTGNIVGVATAISMGGPGAVLWMWLTGVFGIATKYGEAVLSIKYRVVRENGEVAGGPMYVLERGLGMKWLGVLFAIFTAIAAFGIGNMVQANAIANLTEETFKIPHLYTGLILAAFTALVVLGGIRSIARVTEGLVPFMAIFYVGGCIVILAFHAAQIPHALALIFTGAFRPSAVAGGATGFVIRQVIEAGVKRGLFSNESGLGSAPIVAAAAQTRNPVRQALVSSTGTFWDTVVVCAFTGLVLVSSGAWNSGLDGSLMTSAAFGSVHRLGPVILNIGLATFVFSTILGWSYYGEKAAEYLFGRRIVLPYRVLWVLVVILGATRQLDTVWTFSDIANGLMAAPNLIALLLLSGVIVAETRKYLWNDNLDAEADD